MDWNFILGLLFGGGGIGGIVTGVIFFRENRQLKKNEVKSSSADVEEKEINNDKSQIDLGKEFMASTLEMTKKMQDMILASDKERDAYWKKQDADFKALHESVAAIADTVTRLESDVAEIKEEQRAEIAYLNGDYKAFKEQMRLRLEDENKKPANVVVNRNRYASKSVFDSKPKKVSKPKPRSKKVAE